MVDHILTGLTDLPLVRLYHPGVCMLGPGLGTQSSTGATGWSRCIALGGRLTGVSDPLLGRGPPQHGAACLAGDGGMMCDPLWVCCMSSSRGRAVGYVINTCGVLYLA